MKKIKLLILLIFILINSGCAVNYNVIVNEDLSSSEEIILSVDSDTMNELDEVYGKEDVDSEINIAIQEDISNGYAIKTDYSDGLRVTETRKNESLVLNNRIFGANYKYYDFSCNDRYCMLYAVANKNDFVANGLVAQLDFSIQIPFEVVKSNADKVDKLTNTYTWYNKYEYDNDIKLIFKSTGDNVINKNKIIYFIKIGFFAIIGLVGLLYIIRIIFRIVRNNRPY